MKGSAQASTTSKMVTVTIFLDTGHLHAAEEPRRLDEQHADDDHQRDRELELVADDEGAEHVLEHPDEEAADHRARGVVDTADERRGKRVEQHAAHHARI